MAAYGPREQPIGAVPFGPAKSDDITVYRNEYGSYFMEIRPVSIDELKPWDKNPRINDGAVDAVANSIQTFGFNVPILYDQHMTIVAGHVRWKAAKKLGVAPCKSH